MMEKAFLAEHLKDADSADNLLSLSRYVAEHGNEVMVVADNRTGGKLGVIYSVILQEWTIHQSV